MIFLSNSFTINNLKRDQRNIGVKRKVERKKERVGNIYVISLSNRLKTYTNLERALPFQKNDIIKHQLEIRVA